MDVVPRPPVFPPLFPIVAAEHLAVRLRKDPGRPVVDVSPAELTDEATTMR